MLKLVDFQETVEACEVKVGTYSQINEYLIIYENTRSGSFIDLCPTFSNFFFLENTRLFEDKFHDQDGFQGHIW